MSAQLPFRRNDLCILAVDDDVVQLTGVTAALKKEGYQVLNASNGKEALDIMEKETKIDLILTDVMMPVMNGPEFLKAARANPTFAELPIVMMSSNDQYEIVFDCLSRGADDYIIKPISSQVIKNIYANVWLKRKQKMMAQKIQHQIVEASVITQRIEQMKQSFSQTVQTPLNDITTKIESILGSGQVSGDSAIELQNALIELKKINSSEASIAPKPQIPAKMQDYFAGQFGVTSNPSKRVITPIAISTVRKRQAPAPDIPHLQPLNLGEKLLSLDFNIWTVNEKALMNLANDLFAQMDLRSIIDAKEGEIEHFLKRVMQGYKQNPFHNFRRAVDSLQLVTYILKNTKITFQPSELCGILFAALLHDIDHPGMNNQFQIHTSSQLALIYNDKSVLENNSASVGARIIQECFSLNDEQYTGLRSIFLSCVLRTDYAKIQKFLGKAANIEIDWNKKEHRAIALQLLCLMGDLSYGVRPWSVTSYWYGMMRDEQFIQGDTERRLGMKVAPLMDRRLNKPQSLLIKTHFQVLLLPLFQAGVRFFPELENELFRALQQNLEIIENSAKMEQGIENPSTPAPKPTVDQSSN